jgi:peptidoglycan/xylan/chitin deacetylase (PgdA/CDA1 family)
MTRFCSVSVDLDPLHCYYTIHGLGEPRGDLRDLVLTRALPRFAELLARRGIAATLFVVGSDLDEAHARARLGELARDGHELGNHSFTHPYAMGRLDAARVGEEVGRCHDRLTEVAGAPPVGFRAPGYDLSPTMIEALMARSYRYDSSIFPAPLYWGAKALIMGAMAAAGRPTGAVLGDPRALAAPRRPYRPDPRAPWRRGQAPLVELPVTVSPWLRVPAISTSVLLAPDRLRARLLESLRGEPFFNFLLHGVDLLDAEEDGIPGELVQREPVLRTPLLAKRRALEATLDRLAQDFRFLRLRDVAAEVQRRGSL